ncbi:hypothetical protein KIPB_006557 [Kipferlia bialata]|uniref:Uncharacterized protein n=1 Tax=Kipferlia bialata TaxID=797122 RepID=A0A9K3GJU6_9EUKA|nr:hypothetical protein KIPB_006557 [Kipferlia bialata]|eukprot:g6557.t1
MFLTPGRLATTLSRPRPRGRRAPGRSTLPSPPADMSLSDIERQIREAEREVENETDIEGETSMPTESETEVESCIDSDREIESERESEEEQVVVIDKGGEREVGESTLKEREREGEELGSGLVTMVVSQTDDGEGERNHEEGDVPLVQGKPPQSVVPEREGECSELVSKVDDILLSLSRIVSKGTQERERVAERQRERGRRKVPRRVRRTLVPGK